MGNTNDYDLLENGVSILPEGKLVERYSMEYIGDSLWFYVNDNAQLTGGEQEMFAVSPDGEFLCTLGRGTDSVETGV